jgi:hypothetical protein
MRRYDPESVSFSDVSDGTSGRQYSDDEFDRALRELAGGTSGTPRFREPSAEERARLAKEQAKQARKRARPRRRRQRGAERGRGPATTWTSAGVIIVLAAAAGFAWLLLRPPSTTAIGAAVVPTVAQSGPPADPFAGTSADDWADGAAGIVIPAAKPADGFTAAQVAAAYQTTKKLLIAGDLNQPTLLGGAPSAFADLLTSEQRADFLAGLNTKGVNAGGRPVSTRIWVVSFAPGSTELIGSVIKVQGTMSAKSVSYEGTTALAVIVNYLVAYAIEPPGDPADWMRFVTHQYGDLYFEPWDNPDGALQPWDQTIVGHDGSQCGSTDGYQHPDYPSIRESAPAPTESGPALSPYSTATDIPGGGAVCGRSTGT